MIKQNKKNRLELIAFLLLSLSLSALLYICSVKIFQTIKFSDSLTIKLIFGIFSVGLVFNAFRYFIKPNRGLLEIKNIAIALLMLMMPIGIRFVHFNELLGISVNISDNYLIFLKVGFAGSIVWLLSHYPLFKLVKNGYSKYERIIVWGTVVFFTLLYLVMSLSLHLKFRTTIFDLGIYDNKVWTFSRFLPQYSSILSMNNFADHFEPILFVVGLLYRVWNNVIVLLFFEASMVALGFIPLYYLGKDMLKSKKAAFFIGLSFLTFMGIMNAVNYPVHPGTWLPSLYAFALLFAYQRKFIYYYLFLILALSCKESAFIHIFFIGLFLIVALKNKIHGLVTMLLAMVAYFVIFKVIIYTANGGHPYVHGIFSNISNDPIQFIKFVILHPIETLRIAFNVPAKPETLFLTLGSTGFLAIFSLPFLFLILPLFAERLLTDHPAMPTMSFHYSAPISFAIFIGSIYAIAKFQKKYGIRITVPLSIFVFSANLILMFTTADYRSPLMSFFNKSNYVLSQSDRESYEIIKKVPVNSSVISQDVFGPHLSHRQQIGLFGSNDVNKFDYVLLSKDENYGSWPVNYQEVIKTIGQLRVNDQYKVAAENNTLILFEKK